MSRALKIIVTILALLALAAAHRAACAQSCRFDPATGQWHCGGQAAAAPDGMPQLYGIPYYPEPPRPGWAEPRAVLLRNSQPGSRVAYLSGNVVSIGGDASYIISCAHGMGPKGDPVLVVFNDGRTHDIAELVAVDREQDISLLRLKGGPRAEYFQLADVEPPVGTRVRAGGFPDGGAYGGSWSTIAGYEEVWHPSGFKMVSAVVRNAAYQGMSGGHLVTEDGRLAGIIHSVDHQSTYCARLSALRALVERACPPSTSCYRRQSPAPPAPGRPIVGNSCDGVALLPWRSEVEQRLNALEQRPPAAMQPAPDQSDWRASQAEIEQLRQLIQEILELGRRQAAQAETMVAAYSALSGRITALENMPTVERETIIAAVLAELELDRRIEEAIANRPASAAGTAGPSIDQIAAAVLARLEPLYIRVQDARGPAYSTEYQEIRLGTQKQYVTLPFGPRNP